MIPERRRKSMAGNFTRQASHWHPLQTRKMRAKEMRECSVTEVGFLGRGC